jgi:hypothetical protein
MRSMEKALRQLKTLCAGAKSVMKTRVLCYRYKVERCGHVDQCKDAEEARNSAMLSQG